MLNEKANAMRFIAFPLIAHLDGEYAIVNGLFLTSALPLPARIIVRAGDELPESFFDAWGEVNWW